MNWSTARCGRTRAEGLIGDLGEGRLVLRVPQHAVELGLLPPLGRRLQFGRPLLQPRRRRREPFE